MTQLQTASPRPVPAAVNGSKTLPPDIEARRIQLEALFHSVGAHARLMDGLVFDYVGADAVVSLIPVVGDFASGLTTFWLLSKARQAKMPMSDRLVMLSLGVADVAIGLLPGIGDVADVFFRAHEWNARRVQAHVLEHLQQIEFARGGGQSGAALEPLRDQLFRGGRTKAEVLTRLVVSLVLCGGLLAYCTHEAQLRHERIVACEAAGKWFCSLRY